MKGAAMTGNPTEAATTPVAAVWLGPTELQVTWADGHVSRYLTDYLREACPCAFCKVERRRDPREIDLLQPKPTAAALANPAVEPVGRYAVRLGWGDGHSTGIYSFEYLRSICPCPICQGNSQASR